MNVLITGAAGYIGSHALRRLRQGGHQVLAVDNLLRGHRQAVPTEVPFEACDLRETDRLAQLMQQHRIDCVMHFAALTYVGESVQEPLSYYEVNTAGSLSLLRAAHRAGIRRFVFSSTAATYGIPDQMPITEDTPQRPINPYGRSKLYFEHALRDYAHANAQFAFAALRYFNVAGCAADGTLGEDHDPETHLIPNLLNVALGKQPFATVFGSDYPTPDGTCIRDYVHVEDLADAHAVTLEALKPGDQRFYNLGIGRGYSVQEVVDATRKVTRHAIPVQVGARRPGDPPQLYADPSRIGRELGWKARHTSLEGIIESAWRWFKAHPQGYAD